MRQTGAVSVTGAILLALLCIVLLSLPPSPAEAQGTGEPPDDGATGEQYDDEGGGSGDSAAVTGACANPSEVASIPGTTSDERERFQTTVDRFRVSYEVDFEDDDPNAFKIFDVQITDRFGLVESDDTDEDGSQSFIVVEEAGSFAVETDVEPENDATYTVTVEECRGNNDGGNGGGDDLNCDDFDTRADAQEELNEDASDPNNLDADDDGTACETFDYDDDGDVDDPDDVVPGTGDKGPLPDTGGVPLLLGAAGLLLAAGLAARRMIAP